MTYIIAILTIGILVMLHEMGHFFAAKKFNVKIEEFGMGLPPRIFGKKKGETIYSINALPIGGFVRMEGEETRSEDPRSFNKKPIWQRFTIVAAGVVVFWLIAVLIYTVLGATSGIPTAISDDETDLINPQVAIIGIAKDSPAFHANLRAGDVLVEFADESIIRVDQVHLLTTSYADKEVTAKIQRGEEVLQVALTPRKDPPSGEGAIGIALARTGLIKYPWYEAPFQGVVRTWNVTKSVFEMFGVLGSSIFGGEGLPEGAQLSGPVGVIDLLKNSFALGIPSFLSFVAIISVYLAIFNTIPIPALDGGRMFFILLEGVRRRPLPEKLEQRLILISFLVLIPLILWVTVNDLRRLF
jgi:regulator of sigma E protease